MPSVSTKQQHLFGMAYRYKKEGGKASGKVKDLAGSMSKGKLREFAKKKKGKRKKTHTEEFIAQLDAIMGASIFEGL